MKKYKLNESQLTLIKEMQNNRALKEQEFIMQSFSPQQIGEVRDDGSTWYTVKVEVLGGFDDPSAVEGLDNQAYFNAAYKDAINKLREAFRTGEVTIYTIENSKRGVVQIQPEPVDDREKTSLELT